MMTFLFQAQRPPLMLALSQIDAFAAYKKDRIRAPRYPCRSPSPDPESSGNVVQHPAEA